MRKLIKILTSRLVSVVILILLQLLFLLMTLTRVAVAYQILPLFTIMGYIEVIYIISMDEDPSYKTAWCVLILAFPVFGGMLFMLCAGKKMPAKLSHGTTQASARMRSLLNQDESLLKKMQEENEDAYRLFQYGLNTSRFPIYKNTESTYFRSGEEWFPVYLEELKKAKKFIFMEYFIIDEGDAWSAVLDILKEKAMNGVEVRLVYDDFGCCTTLPYHYDKYLNSLGIETYRFNKLRPSLAITMNNRDHRKITVIDNQVAFTGGVNLADEYVNTKERFGYWRDTAVMLKGDAVWSFTVMFLGIYSYLRKDEDTIDYSRYNILNTTVHEEENWFQPFSDTPTDNVLTGLSTHMNLVNIAKKYVYISTPYLILNNDMISTLCLASNNGVDVRILTPHVPDKWYVFMITQHNYKKLISNGVRIYEFTPGFNHAKDIVVDDEYCTVGTVNTDYRSYYLHFENGVLMKNENQAKQMKSVFLEDLEKSHEVTLDECNKTNVFVRILRAVLNLMAPLF